MAEISSRRPGSGNNIRPVHLRLDHANHVLTTCQSRSSRISFTPEMDPCSRVGGEGDTLTSAVFSSFFSSASDFLPITSRIWHTYPQAHDNVLLEASEAAGSTIKTIEHTRNPRLSTQAQRRIFLPSLIPTLVLQSHELPSFSPTQTNSRTVSNSFPTPL